MLQAKGCKIIVVKRQSDFWKFYIFATKSYYLSKNCNRNSNRGSLQYQGPVNWNANNKT